MGKGIEVELKARVERLADIEEKLRQRGRFLDDIDYADKYFRFPGIKDFSFHRFRLRESDGLALVTVKEKLANEDKGVHEYEFEVNDAGAFLEFARVFGFELMLEKTKRGRRYRLEATPGAAFVRQAIVELVTIGGIGEFVEIEIMVDDPSEAQAAAARLKEILYELGVPATSIEDRAYTHILYEQKYGKKGES